MKKFILFVLLLTSCSGEINVNTEKQIPVKTRTIQVYSYDGNLIKEYTGVDMGSVKESSNYVRFRQNGKYVTIRGGIIINE